MDILTPELITHVVSTGGVGALLATLMFWFYRVDRADTVKKFGEIIDRQERTVDLMVSVIKENSANSSRLAAVIEGLQRQVER